MRIEFWKQPEQLVKTTLREVRGRGALRLLRSSRFALTQPDRFATGASTRPRFFCLLHIASMDF